MDFFDMFRPLSVVGKLSLLVTLFPLAAGVSYLLRPSEQRLALMRPLSLATIFAALGAFVASASAILNGIAATGGHVGWGSVAEGAAESLADWWLDNPDVPSRAVASRLMNLAWIGFGGLVEGNI